MRLMMDCQPLFYCCKQISATGRQTCTLSAPVVLERAFMIRGSDIPESAAQIPAEDLERMKRDRLIMTQALQGGRREDTGCDKLAQLNILLFQHNEELLKFHHPFPQPDL